MTTASLPEPIAPARRAGVGIAAALLFGLCAWLWRDLARIAELLIVAALIASPAYLRYHQHREWLCRVFIVACAYMLLINLWAANVWPDVAGTQARYTRHYLKLFLFLPIGWWLAGNQRLAFLLLAATAAGAVLAALASGELQRLPEILSGRRADFGFRNAQHAGVVFGALLLGLLVFAGRVWHWPSSRPARILAAMIWTALLAIALAAVVGSQARQVWLALSISLGLGGAAVALTLMRQRRLLAARAPLLACVLTLTALAALPGFGGIPETLSSRLSAERDQLALLATGKLDALAYGSIGTRIRQWRFALARFAERPLPGWGPATKHLLLDESGLQPALKRFGHFHNSYLELGVAYGIPGLLLLPLLVGTLLYRLLRAWRRALVPNDWAMFGGLSLVFFLIVNGFESYVMYRTGYVYLAIVGGAVYALLLPGAATPFPRQPTEIVQ